MRKFLIGAAALGFGVSLGFAGEGFAAPAPVLASSKASAVEKVGYKKRRTYYRDYDGEHVRAPFASVDTGRDTWVAAPFARVYSGGRGTWVRAPFVDLWVPR
jgi:hypothetical protein